MEEALLNPAKLREQIELEVERLWELREDSKEATSARVNKSESTGEPASKSDRSR